MGGPVDPKSGTAPLQTPTHALIALAVAGKPGERSINTATILGSLMPDVTLFVLFAWDRFVLGDTPQHIFDVAFFSARWQNALAFTNSAPLFLVALGLGLGMRLPLLTVFSIGALTHVGADFLTHNDDAYRHLWPLTDWRFNSPVSYWDPNHYGRIAAPLEAVMALGLSVMLWRRHQSRVIRTGIAVAAAGYAAGVAYFAIVLSWSLAAA